MMTISTQQREMELWLSSFFPVSVIFFVLVGISYTGIFDNAELEIGLEHYAEEAWLPFTNVMPLNTLINFGYTGLGLYWCWFTKTATTQGMLKGNDSRLFYCLNIMASIYGVVQFLRITTQTVIWAVLDQWCTLPFFALLLGWGLYLQRGWSSLRFFVILTISILSYGLVLISKIGFEIALGFHILAAVTGGIIAYRKYPPYGSLRTFFLALLSCSGFVILKLLDHQLPFLFCGFKYVSGHFLSKICDIYQIYFVNDFFLDITLEKAASISLEDKLNFEQCSGVYQHLKHKATNDIRYENPFKSKQKYI
ncbi:transmembrane protein 187 [Aplysia californica]|uniref:Transmembrane protein 187 n=1 Tax=Aplysia californica TaxID=6500 RepID=A0ABM0JII9_APLCA|nr:transmembrane protein 187 [Aplysia californica]